MVTIQLEPFLPYVNLALKNSYRTGIWLSNIITQAEHFRPCQLQGGQGNTGRIPLSSRNSAVQTKSTFMTTTVGQDTSAVCGLELKKE